MIEPSRKSDLVSYPIRDIVQEAKILEKQGKDMIYLIVDKIENDDWLKKEFDL